MATNTATGSNLNPTSTATSTTRVSDIPNQQQNSNLEKLGIINWFGSSYSGADIKVIAHLYDTVNMEEYVHRLELQKRYAQAIIDGLNNIDLGSVQAIIDISTSLETKRDAILSAAGLFAPPGNEERRAGNYIISVIAPLRTAQEWLLIKIGLINQHISFVRNYEDQIAAFQEIECTSTKVLGELQTMSIETYRKKRPAYVLGSSYPKRFCRGNRMIAGSMIFTVFDRHVLLELMRAMQMSSHYGDVDTQSDISTYLPDQIPPIDITIAFANEYGSISEQRIYGLEFVNDSVTYSIEDLISENTNNFVARDVDIMLPKGRMRLSQLQRGMHLGETSGQDISGSSLLFGNAQYEAYIDRIGVRRRNVSI